MLVDLLYCARDIDETPPFVMPVDQRTGYQVNMMYFALLQRQLERFLHAPIGDIR